MTTQKRPLKYLRRMTEEDLSAVMFGEMAAYTHPWTEKIFRDCLDNRHYSCWVLELNRQIAGHVVISAAVGEAHILNLCVYPQNQRQGWGRKMLNEAEWIAKQHKAETCFLEVRPSNVVGITLYQTMGYNEVGLRKNYYPADQGREDAIIMAKALF